ncbi:zinc-binding dehydrogenase [Solibacillus sp. CAU 1738]|uniref:quinone oxidoreductase family protein n=1 Tax=Solibacillus sp. CAU 1738 TaxID=3140363 RepID=UPI003260568C
MKAVRQYAFGSKEVLQYEEVAMPTISNNEVLIRGVYTSVNYADIKSRIGSKAKGDFPFTLGLDIAGIVEDAGNTKFQKGDRVIAFPKAGSYAEYVVASEQLVFKIPQSVSFEQAASMPTVSILAYILLHEVAQVKPTDSILIHSASGGVGTVLTQFAKLAGVEQIFATVGNKGKAAYVKSLGADYVYTYENFVEEVLTQTNQKGVTVVFDSVAGSITQQSLSCLANYGTLVQFGNSSGQAGTISTSDVHSSCRNIKGFSLGTTRKEDPKRLAPIVEKVFQYFEDGSITIPIAEIVTLKDVKRAHELMESRQHKGKILLQLS